MVIGDSSAKHPRITSMNVQNIFFQICKEVNIETKKVVFNFQVVI